MIEKRMRMIAKFMKIEIRKHFLKSNLIFLCQMLFNLKNLFLEFVIR